MVRHVKFPGKLLVFAGISLLYQTPLIIIRRGTVDTETYIDDCIDATGLILGMNAAYGRMTWTLMQDGASAHTSATTMEYLRMYANVLEDWPSGSPDMNPIENLWAILKERVAALAPKTLDDLEAAIRIAWEEMTSDMIAHLIDSMPSRLQATVRAQGHPNGY
jgi:hypothetical protein